MTILYLGLDPSRYPRPVLHYPILKIVPKSVTVPDSFTHLLFTSRQAVLRWREIAPEPWPQTLAIGEATAALLRNPLIAPYATQEGMIELLRTLDLRDAKIVWPRSAQARPLLEVFLRPFAHQILDLYDTEIEAPGPLPDLTQIEEIVFTSPSCVRGFIQLFGALPKDKRLTTIGPVTQAALCQFITKAQNRHGPYGFRRNVLR